MTKEIFDAGAHMNYKADFEAYEVMWINITGKERPEAKTSKLPMTRDDSGLIDDLYEFMKRGKICPVFTMSVGGGGMNALFRVHDGEKVVKWLHENGGCHCGNYSSG